MATQRPKKKKQQQRQQRPRRIWKLPAAVRHQFFQIIAWIYSGEPERVHAVWVEYGGDPDASFEEIRRCVDRWTDSGARSSTKAKGTGRPPSDARVQCRRMLSLMRRKHPDKNWAEATQRVAELLQQTVKWVRADPATRRAWAKSGGR